MTATPLRRLEWAGLLALMIAAGGLRLWHLWDIPSPTDELLSVKRGLQIARGELLPLTDFEPYIGALWTYLLAGGFWLAGPSPLLGRLLPLLVGTLTVGATYLLGRELGGRACGWIAALLLATSSAHVLATSHPAWSHCLVPLFGTLGLWQLHRAVRLGRGDGLLASGCWLGLALQSHLTSLALLPGAAGYLLLRGRPWFKTPWPALAALVGLLLVSNIAVFNLLTGFETLRRAETVRAAYARPKGSGLELYAGNAQRMALSTLRVVGGAIDIRPNAPAYLLDPLTLAGTAAALGGLVLLARRGCPLPWLTVLSYAGLLLVFNAKYEVIPNARFLTPLLPLLFACAGVGLTALAGRVRPGPWRSVGLAVALLALCGGSLFGLARRYGQMESSAVTTAGLTGLVDALEAARRPDEPVLLDRNLDRLWLDGGGDLWMALDFELTRRRVPVADLRARVTPPGGDANPCDRQQVVAVRVDLAQGAPTWLGQALGPDAGALPRRFWAFRVVPLGARPESLGASQAPTFAYHPPLVGSARTVDRCAPGRLI